MDQVSNVLLGQACRTFLRLAYPGGQNSIPAKKRVYYDLPLDRPVTDFLPPAAAEDVCQVLPGAGEGIRGYAFRLGSAHFPHLKLKVQLIDYDQTTTWVFMVDTHDAMHLPPGHPDTQAWKGLQSTNRTLKEIIEQALEKEGLVTFNSLLRCDLNKNTNNGEPEV
jgi:hypothetical protein